MHIQWLNSFQLHSMKRMKKKKKKKKKIDYWVRSEPCEPKMESRC